MAASTSSDIETDEATCGLKEQLRNLEQNIQLVSKQIKDGESKRDEKKDFNKEQYWNTVAAIFKALSMEATKISLAFDKKPFPSNKNAQMMITELEKCMLTLVSIYYSLPLSQGLTLRSNLQQAVLQGLDNLQGFASSLIECISSDSHTQRLQWTGCVWEAADFVFLRDNKECVLKSLQDTSELVEDALGEIEQATECDGQMEDFMGGGDNQENEEWSEQDKMVVATATGLVKTGKSLMKKTTETVCIHADVETKEGITALDDLVALTSQISSAVDDFVCGFYAPVNYASLTQNGTALSDLFGNILTYLRSSPLTTNEDSKWLDFLSQACTHNLDKLKESVVQT